jgi:hypothetical protein
MRGELAMMFQTKKIQVCCIRSVTGGPELLHQLVDQLRKNGHDATIVYLPLGEPFECPEPYRIYDAPQSDLQDEPGVLVIVPEVSTALLRKLKQATGAVWWLSVDNYLGVNRESCLKDAYRRYKSIILGRRLPLRSLRKFHHFAQSHYAFEFLEKAGIKAYPLSDYLGAAHLEQPKWPLYIKQDIIVYNPKKGVGITTLLRKANPDIRFIAIENMAPQKVAELLARAKLYIDFGHHPGKDRLPREAAMAGCCVITGRRGSAANPFDITIPEKYKFDERSSDFLVAFRKQALSLLRDYENRRLEFDSYRARIRAENALFIQQVEELFGVVQRSDGKSSYRTRPVTCHDTVK